MAKADGVAKPEGDLGAAFWVRVAAHGESRVRRAFMRADMFALRVFCDLGLRY